MALPGNVALKLDLYTLACHKLLDRLDELARATRGDSRMDLDTCLRCFDYGLKRFVDGSSAIDRDRGADQLGILLRGEAELVRDSNPAAGAIFDAVIDAIRGNAHSWRCQDDLERCHDLGRDLAREFFSGSSFQGTRERLSRLCQLDIDYGGPSPNDRRAALADPFGYRAAPMVYYPHRWDDQARCTQQHVILLRFTFDHDFATYLSYPFLFLHEYTAHVYAADHGNELFNDGWMMYAAHAFLCRKWVRTPDGFAWNRQQAEAFDKLQPRLNNGPRRACAFAKRFDLWLSDVLPGRFMDVTHELCDFQPMPGETRTWPDRFINNLEGEFEANRRELLAKLRASANVRDLITMLRSP